MAEVTAELPSCGVACTVTQLDPPSAEPSNCKVAEKVPASVAPTVFHFGSMVRNKQAVVETEGWQEEAEAESGAVTKRPDCPKLREAAKSSTKTAILFIVGIPSEMHLTVSWDGVRFVGYGICVLVYRLRRLCGCF